jgi:hypothetical protein
MREDNNVTKDSSASDKLFWEQMFYVVAGIAVMCLGVFLLGRSL